MLRPQMLGCWTARDRGEVHKQDANLLSTSKVYAPLTQAQMWWWELVQEERCQNSDIKAGPQGLCRWERAHCNLLLKNRICRAPATGAQINHFLRDECQHSAEYSSSFLIPVFGYRPHQWLLRARTGSEKRLSFPCTQHGFHLKAGRQEVLGN